MKFSDDYKEARIQFEEFDLNGDGFITKDEIAFIMEKVDPEFTSADVEEMMKEADTNEDGKICWDEFKIALMTADAQKQAKKEEEKFLEDMRPNFDQIDIDGDGLITKEEFVNAVKKVKPEISSAAIDKVISWADTDKDGKISWDEFIRMMTVSECMKGGYYTLDIHKDGCISKEVLFIADSDTCSNLEPKPEILSVDIADHDDILERLETLMVAKKFPEFLHDNKRLFKFKSIVKLANSNLNSIREKKSEGVSQGWASDKFYSLILI